MYRVFEAGRAPYMREKGGITEKMAKYIEGIHSMLDEMEECLDEMEGDFGERDEYGSDRMGYRMGDGRMGDGRIGERRSARTGRYIRG